MKDSFNIIAALDQKQGIGKAGALPWSLAHDMQHFKTLTTSHTDPKKQNAVIMGRTTWDSLPKKFRPLPHRLNIVISRSPQKQKNSLWLTSLHQALTTLTQSHDYPNIENIFVIGGEQLYQEALRHPACRKLYITHIDQDFHCDRFFPEFKNHFQQTHRSDDIQVGTLSFYFAEYEPFA